MAMHGQEAARFQDAGRVEQRAEWLEHFAVVARKVLLGRWKETRATVEFAHLVPEEAEDLHAAMTWLLTTIMTCLRERRGLTPAERAHMRALSALRLWQGIPSAQVHDNIDEAADVCLREFTELAWKLSGPRGGRGELDNIVADLEPLLHDVHDSFTLSDLDVRRWFGRPATTSATLAPHRPASVPVVRELLRGDNDPANAIERLGWQRPERGVLVIATPASGAFTPDLMVAVAVLARKLPGGAPGPVLAHPTPHGTVVASWPPGADGKAAAILEETARTFGMVLVVSTPSTPKALRLAFAWLPHAIDLATTAGGKPGVVPTEELERRATVSCPSAELARWRVQRTLGGLLAQQPRVHRPVLDMLAAFHAAGLDVKAAARRLGKTTSGVLYSMKRCSELTGLDVRVHIAELVQAWEQLNHYADALPPPGERTWVSHLADAG